MEPTFCHIRRPAAFTLIELLVVVAIIGLLMAILLPALDAAREQARAVTCLANLHGIGQGLVLYEQNNNELLLPAFNMTGYGAPNTSQTVDGWPAILDRDSLVAGYNGPTNNPFFCPDTLNIEGMAGGQTATDPNKPKGYQDYPTIYLNGGDSGGQADPATFPVTCVASGSFSHEIRCGYWINANNPIGGTQAATVAEPNPYYTWTVGYTAADGTMMTNEHDTKVLNPAALVVIADGIYMGRQSVTQLGMTNLRVGYRHRGGSSVSANTAFADGHAQPLVTAVFPLTFSAANGLTYAQVQALNFGLYSVYCDPQASLP